MKFYNPFKWHIFKTFNGGYYVHRRSYLLLFNYYVDLDDGFHWTGSTDAWKKYCIGTYDQAKSALSKINSDKFVE
jgi:hypothetical protein